MTVAVAVVTVAAGAAEFEGVVTFTVKVPLEVEFVQAFDAGAASIVQSNTMSRESIIHFPEYIICLKPSSFGGIAQYVICTIEIPKYASRRTEAFL